MKHIGDRPLPEMYGPGLEIDCQCARCGSSCGWQDCCHCEDGSLGSDCIDDLCHGGQCIHGDSGFIACDICDGRGGWQHCLSGAEWCAANPMPGREGIEQGQIEWFTIKAGR